MESQVAMVKMKTSGAGRIGDPRPRLAAYRPADAGFSVVELLVVIAVLAVAASLAQSALLPRSSSADVAAAAHLIAAKLKNARNASIRLRSVRRVYFDVGNRHVWNDGARSKLALDRQIHIGITGARSEQRSATVASVRFNPNGSSSGATVRLQGSSSASEVRVNWYTGRVSMHRLR